MIKSFQVSDLGNRTANVPFLLSWRKWKEKYLLVEDCDFIFKRVVFVTFVAHLHRNVQIVFRMDMWSSGERGGRHRRQMAFSIHTRLEAVGMDEII